MTCHNLTRVRIKKDIKIIGSEIKKRHHNDYIKMICCTSNKSIISSFGDKREECIVKLLTKVTCNKGQVVKIFGVGEEKERNFNLLLENH